MWQHITFLPQENKWYLPILIKSYCYLLISSTFTYIFIHHKYFLKIHEIDFINWQTHKIQEINNHSLYFNNKWTVSLYSVKKKKKGKKKGVFIQQWYKLITNKSANDQWEWREHLQNKDFLLLSDFKRRPKFGSYKVSQLSYFKQ